MSIYTLDHLINTGLTLSLTVENQLIFTDTPKVFLKCQVSVNTYELVDTWPAIDQLRIKRLIVSLVSTKKR